MSSLVALNFYLNFEVDLRHVQRDLKRASGAYRIALIS